MATVAVAHVDLMAKGGGEGVAMNAIEALQRDHDVTLVTLTDPDVSTLNDYFRTNVDGDALTVVRPRATTAVLEALEGQLGVQLYNLRNALLNRAVAGRAHAFDLVFGTDNELSVPGPLVQYVHTPRFARLVVSKRVGEDSFVDHAYDRLSYRVGGYDAERVASSRLLTNSDWMADVVQDAYDARPEVVHPPVDTEPFDSPRWSDREEGFVTVGRLARYKNVDDVIRIIDGVRDRGHDVHLHVVGPSYDETYRAELDAMAEERSYVELEGEVARDELVELICTHRYGIHGKRHEHFGMAVAEMAAAGALPFVPANGGQRDIVDGRASLLYHTVEDAIETVDRVLSSPDRQCDLRPDPDDIKERFGRDRFRDQVRTVVREELP